MDPDPKIPNAHIATKRTSKVGMYDLRIDDFPSTLIR
jgi:hypothetical protein